MHILEIATSIPPKEISWQETTSFSFINFKIDNPLFFSLKRLISGGGPFFSDKISLAKIEIFRSSF